MVAEDRLEREEGVVAGEEASHHPSAGAEVEVEEDLRDHQVAVEVRETFLVRRAALGLEARARMEADLVEHRVERLEERQADHREEHQGEHQEVLVDRVDRVGTDTVDFQVDAGSPVVDPLETGDTTAQLVSNQYRVVVAAAAAAFSSRRHQASATGACSDLVPEEQELSSLLPLTHHVIAP